MAAGRAGCLPVYALLLPGLLLYGMWAAFPLLQSFVMSFTDWRLRGESPFLGLDNYTRALSDPFFWKALWTTVGYTVVTVAGQLLLGLGAALLLDQRFRGRGLLRLVYYLPVITSWVIVSLIFVWLYNGQTGSSTGCSMTSSASSPRTSRGLPSLPPPSGDRGAGHLEGRRLDHGRVPGWPVVRAHRSCTRQRRWMALATGRASGT